MFTTTDTSGDDNPKQDINDHVELLISSIGRNRQSSESSFDSSSVGRSSSSVNSSYSSYSASRTRNAAFYKEETVAEDFIKSSVQPFI